MSRIFPSSFLRGRGRDGTRPVQRPSSGAESELTLLLSPRCDGLLAEIQNLTLNH